MHHLSGRYNPCVTTGPPFRAEHVGSLLRPEQLLKARAEAEGDQYRQASGPLNYSQLKEIEDAAIQDVVRLQEDVGLQVVTDGEFRRRSWFQDFVLSLTGTEITFFDSAVSAAMPFQDDSTVDKLPGHIVRVTRAAESDEGNLHGALQVSEKPHFANSEDQPAVPEHAAFLGRPGCDRLDDLPRHRGVLGRRGEDMGCRDPGAASARLPLRPDRRCDVSVDLRSARPGGFAPAW